jgi:hypothetical protein
MNVDLSTTTGVGALVVPAGVTLVPGVAGAAASGSAGAAATAGVVSASGTSADAGSVIDQTAMLVSAIPARVVRVRAPSFIVGAPAVVRCATEAA